MFTGVVLFISFQNFPFAFTTWLTVGHERPSVGPILALSVPSSASVIISSFRFKMGDMLFFLSLERLEPTVGLVVGLLSSLLCFRPEEGEELGERPASSTAVRTHTSVNLLYYRAWFVVCVCV